MFVAVAEVETLTVYCVTKQFIASTGERLGLELAASDDPASFRALVKEESISLRSARSDACTRESAQGHLEPLGIF